MTIDKGYVNSTSRLEKNIIKLKKLISILLDTIYRDNIYLISPIINWTLIDGVNRHFRDNYNKVLPTLQMKDLKSLIYHLIN
ncbi:hypothetical protein HMPREF9074_08776 [Capnocytophaga sp. oral taxon 329 str. F0087]|nr:hypothetical protein HMPREF9074_08776 [Capnocytophaga sp. oral taxon 329 str. F0087]